MSNFPSEIRGYQPIQRCGKGAFGEVWLVTDAVGNHRALKIVSKAMIGADYQKEFNGLKTYQTRLKPHPNLIQIYHIEECDSFFYYTMEYANNMGDEQNYIPSTLENWIQKFGPLGYDTLTGIFEGILDGVEYLHAQGLVHRDIKPDNIIFVGTIPKLSDIGLVSSVSKTMSLAGTQAYIPPEVLTGAVKNPGPGMDIYALGKTLYRAFSGQQPDDFPVVPHRLLQSSDGRKLNRLIKFACHPALSFRLQDLNEFRSCLHGNIGFFFSMKLLFANVLWIFLLPLKLLCYVFIYCLKNVWIKTTVVVLLLIWLIGSCSLYQKMDMQKRRYDYRLRFDAKLFWLAMKQALALNIPVVPKYDLYDFDGKSDFSLKEYGEYHLVTKEEYMNRKYPGIDTGMSVVISVGDDEEEGHVEEKLQITSANEPKRAPNYSTPRRYELKKSGVKSDIWDFSGKNIRWEEHVLVLPERKGRMVLNETELPNFYELKFTLLSENTSGYIDLLFTASEYWDPIKKSSDDGANTKYQIKFKILSDGKTLSFAPAYCRLQDGMEEDSIQIGTPKFQQYHLENSSCEITVIRGDTMAVYIDGNLVWNIFAPFFGGKFSMAYQQEESAFRIKDFSLYDIYYAESNHKGDFFKPLTPLPNSQRNMIK